MKKWVKTGLSIGASASLIMPTIASAGTVDSFGKLKDIEKPDILKELTKSASEQKILAFKKQQEMKEQQSKDTIIIKHSKPLANSVHQKAGTTLQKSIPSLGYDVVKLRKGQKLKSVLAYYSQVEGVTAALPSVQYKSLSMGDPKKSEQYHHSLLQIDEALKLAGNHKVTVAVIDTGMDIKHPELKSVVLPPYNAADPANGAFTDQHGTHVAGIIAAEANNGIGGQGISPNAKILPIDVFNGGWGASDYVIAEGIMYAIEKGANVINMSLGGYMESPIFEEAVQKAIDAGITVVAAAGNESWDEYSSPASYDGVISVGATNSKNELAYFSNFGPSVNLVAPGEDVYSTVIDYLKGSSFMRASGTSMASPMVAGVAALLKSKYPDLKPQEVKYILEQTATDLGEKGYDLKFAHGLVNPVAALKYDMKNLPKMNSLTQEEKLANALQLKAKGEDVHTGKFTKPEERHYYKIALNKGEFVQTVLAGTDMYDYSMEFSFVPNKGNEDKDKPLKVNDTKAGGTEGYLYKAEEDGTLLIEVRDANGNYSLDGKSEYTFKAEKLAELIVDKSSKDNVIPIEAIPYTSSDDKNGPFTLVSEDGGPDKDYFSFSVEERQIISFDVSGVPGVDSSLALYFKDDLEMERPQGLPSYEPWPYPMKYANNGGKSEGEKLVFEAIPGMEYVLEVSGEPSQNFFFGSFFFGFFKEPTPSASAIPYELNVTTLDLPPDEDGLPIREEHLEQEYMDGEMTEEAYQEAKKAQFEKSVEVIVEGDYWRMFDREYVDQIVEHAVPFTIGKDQKGYFQFDGDEDFYSFTSDSDAIYEFEFDKAKDQNPWATILEYDEKNNDLIPVEYIGGYYFFGPQPEMKATVPLKKDKKYFIQLQNGNGISGDPYVIKSKNIMPVPKNNKNPDNNPLLAQILKPGQAIEDHLIYGGDSDYYYYKHRGDDKIFNLQVTTKPFTDQQLKDLPKSVTNELIPFAYVIEDTNGNMKIDPEEAGKVIDLATYYNGSAFYVNGSFKAKKDTGYFVLTHGWSFDGLSVQPYEIQLNDLTRASKPKDTVVNNVPSKPLSLKAEKGQLVGKGYFNAGVDFGDKDYYQLNVDKKGTATITLKAGFTLDGVIKVYNEKGTLVKEFDYYGVGDDEVGILTLEKGKYFIEISEAMSRASIIPYELTVQIK
ncbi:S8 family serine peptidase [Bacillus sp. FJAT-29790]|uniref:S8 family peptidase n=1 Tax=Bacillus sp. FJAT-29790 TaxID=1895002 RepID=UPI001C245E2D|nr:S8 family serine peptidase [Bacillus sp. FJAT-29790]MBU8881107.1 S8 family serine peptidase [Bacillus sp. FJAT-29790]